MLLGRTGIVFNQGSYKPLGLEPYIYRYRGCAKGLNGNTPADQYQKQKIIHIRGNNQELVSSLAHLSLLREPPQIFCRICPSFHPTQEWPPRYRTCSSSLVLTKPSRGCH